MARSKSKSKFQKLCNNLYFLYFIYALVLINILTFVYLKQWNSILLFLLLVLVFQYLTKNICILLLSSLLITNIFSSNVILFEGFKGKSKKKNSKQGKNKQEKNSKQGKKSKQSNKKGNIKTKTNKGEKALGGGEPQLFKKHINESKNLHKKLSDKYHKLPEKEKRKLANHPQVKERVNYIKNLDKKKNISDFDNQIDYSKTYNDSMKHLNKMLSDKGLEGLTNETKELINSQKALTANIQNLEPWLQNAGGMLKKLDLGNITSTLGSFEGIFGKGKK